MFADLFIISKLSSSYMIFKFIFLGIIFSLISLKFKFTEILSKYKFEHDIYLEDLKEIFYNKYLLSNNRDIIILF